MYINILVYACTALYIHIKGTIICYWPYASWAKLLVAKCMLCMMYN